MSIGCFTEKKHVPSPDEIAGALGPNTGAWEELTRYLRSNFTVDEMWKFMYGKKYGWALHFKRDKKMLTNLYPSQGGFTVQINLPESAVQQALAMDLPDHFQAAIQGAYPFPEGRWIFIPYQSEGDTLAFKSLIELRVAIRLDKKGK